MKMVYLTRWRWAYATTAVATFVTAACNGAGDVTPQPEADPLAELAAAASMQGTTSNWMDKSDPFDWIRGDRTHDAKGRPAGAVVQIKQKVSKMSLEVKAGAGGYIDQVAKDSMGEHTQTCSANDPVPDGQLLDRLITFSNSEWFIVKCAGQSTDYTGDGLNISEGTLVAYAPTAGHFKIANVAMEKNLIFKGNFKVGILGATWVQYLGSEQCISSEKDADLDVLAQGTCFFDTCSYDCAFGCETKDASTGELMCSSGECKNGTCKLDEPCQNDTYCENTLMCDDGFCKKKPEEIKAIDTEGDVGENPSLRLFDGTTPRISYFKRSRKNLKYYDGTREFTVDALGAVGNFSSLDIGGGDKGKPHIAYWDATNTYLKYAHRDNGDFVTMGIADDAAKMSSLERGPNGKLQIAFVNHNNVLKLATLNDAGTGWDKEVVYDFANTGGGPALATTPKGRPRIAFRDKASKALNFISRDGGNWYPVQVIDQYADSREISMVLDGGERPHVVYRGSRDSSSGGGVVVRYAHNAGNGWKLEVIEDTNAIDHTAVQTIALDANGQPYVAYEVIQSGIRKLKVARRVGENKWSVRFVRTYMGSSTVHLDVSGSQPSIAIDRNGKPHIAFYDPSTDDLKLARLPKDF